jgi:putative transposase
MPRRPRDVSPGFHHAWVGATGGWDYFLDEVDRIGWVRYLAATVAHMGWKCVAFCQMSTHVHLLLSVPDLSLASGMRDLNREYSCAFNARHSRKGTFARSRFGSRRIVGSGDLLTAYAYVVLNPVAERLCLRPEEWRWSSHRTTLGVVNDFPFVDGRPVVAEAGGSRADLRRAVESVARSRLQQPRLEPGSGRVLRS